MNFEGEIISARFSADDLILISRTKRRGMERLLQTVNNFCVAMKMQLSVEKTMILTAGPQDSVWTVSEEDPDLESVIVEKYLGVTI